MSGKVGVAISTVPERAAMVNEAMLQWHAVAPRGSGLELIVATEDARRAGVAANKNRGIKMLMDEGCEHLFLADDDMYPLSKFSWTRYVDSPELHLSLSWGNHRRERKELQTRPGLTSWTWPRGVLLYVHRSVIEAVGGMDTRYGTGGHEHCGFSRRVHQAGLTDHPYLDIEQDVRQWFHCEDMQRPGESVNQLVMRRRRITTVRRTSADSKRIQQLWHETDGDTSFVEYR